MTSSANASRSLTSTRSNRWCCQWQVFPSPETATTNTTNECRPTVIFTRNQPIPVNPARRNLSWISSCQVSRQPQRGRQAHQSAPTGSGKTAIFELAFLRMIKDATEHGEDKMAIYMAPTKVRGAVSMRPR